MASHSTDVDAPHARNSDDEEGSRRSRARVSRACTRCRSRKDKCDALQPQCSNCVSAGQSCLYVAATKKRGLPEGYVRGLEKLWAVMLQKMDGLDTAVRHVINGHEEELLRIWNHQKLGDDLHTTWKESSVLGDLERLLSRIDNAPPDLKRKRDREDSETMPLSNAGIDTTDALTPDFKVTDISSTAAPNGGFHHPLGWDPEARNVNFDPPRVAPSSSTPVNIGMGIVRDLNPISTNLSSRTQPLPSNASELLDQYFIYTHCWLPILDRPHVLRKFYENTRSRNPISLDTGDLACLWAICAYTQQQTKHLGPQHGPDEAVIRMRNTARGLIPLEGGSFLLGHVQALLILMLLDVGLGDWTSAWMRIGIAVRALLDTMEVLGLSQPEMIRTDSDLIQRENGSGWNPRSGTVRREKWQPVLQGCFILETVVSLRLGRPPHLRSNHLDLDSAQLMDEDGHEEWEPWGIPVRDMAPLREPAFVMSCFNRLTELFMIANDGIENGRYEESSGASDAEGAISRLSSLSQRYPFPIAETILRPPHQLFLQACHSSILASSSQTRLHVQQSAGQQWCAILELFERSFSLPGNCGIPSLLVAICLLVDPCIDNLLSWSNGPNGTRQTYDKLVSALAVIWPGFTTLHRTSAAPSAIATTPRRLDRTSDSLIAGTNPISSSGTGAQPRSSASLHDAFASKPDYALGYAPSEPIDYDPGFEQVQQHIASDYRPMSIDLPSQDGQTGYGMDMTGQRGTSMGIGTSPSFNGDEIDALFHEMAQLDTTQWTMDRTQGLKDFGFADDTTFEAFCNDPDRLMLSDGDMGPAFSNGSHAPSRSQTSGLNVGGPQPGTMSFEDIFR